MPHFDEGEFEASKEMSYSDAGVLEVLGKVKCGRFVKH